MKNAIVYAILTIPPITAIIAFYLERSCVYGIQDSGLAKHRGKLRAVGRVAVGVTAFTLTLMAIYLAKNHQ